LEQKASEKTNRWAFWVRAASLLLMLASLVLLLRALPIDNLLRLFQAWVAGLGVWGPLIFAGVYAVWATLFLPGFALTLAGGAVFGLLKGTVTVLCGATLGAALSFLIARYFARERVTALARANPKLRAIDRAIGEGGWKIVALLRLSPAVPFNLQNYLYGVTAIPFWPCVLTSFIFMIPGTFMYVYIGSISAQGLAAASGAGGASNAELALKAVGLAATVAVTVYVTRIASRAIKEQTAEAEEETPEPEAKPASLRGVVVIAAVAVALFSSAVYAYIERDALKGLVGPPQVTLAETYERRAAGPDLDHSLFDELLATFVDDQGFVDYRGLGERSADLDRYLASLAEAPFEEMGRDQKLALLINAYNAFTLRLILEHYPTASITDIPEQQRWDARRWDIAGEIYSLNDIEHRTIRPNFAEPRIHFALVCAAVGCPRLRKEAYVAARIDEQLEDQTRSSHSGDRWFRFEESSGVVHLTQLYNWYGGDFAQQAGSATVFAARYVPALKQALDAGTQVEVRWLDYDWSLNEAR